MKSNLLYRFLIIALIAGGNVAFDQLTKVWATNTLKPKPSQSYLGDFFRLTYVMNDGAFLGLGSDRADASKAFDIFRFVALKVFPIILLFALFLHMLLSKTMSNWQLVAFSFILGGGISNIYDRLLYGEVVDFMNLGIPNLIRTGIFNFADVSIMVGLFMMLPTLFTKERA